MIMRPVLYMVAFAAALYGFSAAAATVVPYGGDVFVSRGNGFQKINGATVVKVGDAVMVSPDGLAQVQLEDGNVITVSPGEVLSIPAKARAKDAVLPDGAHATQADPGSFRADAIAALAMVAGGITAAALASRGGGGPTIIVPVSP
jgi:hypothetical protein